MVWLLLPCACAFAQNFAIDWFTIDGGGGTSTGGLYSVRGTMGQPDAGRMSGGPYSLAGGLWVLPIAVQTINAPRLTIVPTATGKAILSWVPAAPGFVLQETWSLTSPNWSNSPSGTTNPVTVPATLRAKFYRLTKP